MDIRRIAPESAPTLPLTTAEAKVFLRVDGTDEDSLIDEIIAAAVEFIEDLAWCTIKLSTWELVLPDFPGRSTDAEAAAAMASTMGGPRPTRRQMHPAAIRLPRGPVREVVSITYYDSDGETEQISVPLGHEPAGCQQSLTDDDCLVSPLPGTTWPTVQAGRLEGVVVRFTAGYDGTTFAFPPKIKQAVRLLLAHWYENREAYMTGTVAKDMELGLLNLCSSFDQRRFNPGR